MSDLGSAQPVDAMVAIVAVVMGSDSDWPVMSAAADVLTEFGVAHEVDVISAHRMPHEMLEWGSTAADTVGGRNLMGVKSPAIDAMIERLLTSEDQEDFRAAAQAIDRVLTAGRYVIPIYQWNVARIAHDANLRFPETIPLFGDWPGWQPDVWWCEDDC